MRRGRHPTTRDPVDTEGQGGAPDTADRPDRCRSRIGTKEEREGDILGTHAVASRKVSCGPRDPEDAVIAAGGEPPRLDRFGEKLLRFRIDRAEALDLGDREVGVHAVTARGWTSAHPLTCRDDAVTHVGGSLPALVAEALEGDTRNVHPQVDAIEERTRELAAIALDLLRKARAFAIGIAPEAARARVQIRRGNEASNWSSRRRSPNSAD